MSYKIINGRAVATIIPARLLFQAPAKVNLKLHVQGLRESDGYHMLEMENVSITLADIVEMEVDHNDTTAVSIVLKDGPINLTSEQRAILSSSDNIAVRAAYLFSEYFKVAFSLKISLTKKIPLGSGLAGGSADGAAVLRGLAHLFGIDRESIMPLAIQLGADLPFCMYRMPARISGIGERIAPCKLNIGRRIIIIVPKIGLSTKAVFAEFDRLAGIGGTASGVNDLLPAALSLAPELAELHKVVAGISGISGMTGSGSAFFVVPSEECFNTAHIVEAQNRIGFDLFDERIILN